MVIRPWKRNLKYLLNKKNVVKVYFYYTALKLHKYTQIQPICMVNYIINAQKITS